MIQSFRSAGLHELFTTGQSAQIDQKMHKRILVRLDTLHSASNTRELNLPGYNYHPLKPSPRHSIHVNGPWCITFEFRDGNAFAVDFENYH